MESSQGACIRRRDALHDETEVKLAINFLNLPSFDLMVERANISEEFRRHRIQEELFEVSSGVGDDL